MMLDTAARKDRGGTGERTQKNVTVNIRRLLDLDGVLAPSTALAG